MQGARVGANLSTDRPKNSSSASNGVIVGPGVHQIDSEKQAVRPGYVAAEPQSESTLYALATVLRASPESDALVVLGRLLDSLPLGFHVSDCGGAFNILYANRVWEQWLGPDKLPVAASALRTYCRAPRRLA